MNNLWQQLKKNWQEEIEGRRKYKKILIPAFFVLVFIITLIRM